MGQAISSNHVSIFIFSHTFCLFKVFMFFKCELVTCLHLCISSNNNIQKKKSYPESYYKPFLEYQKIIAIAK